MSLDEVEERLSCDNHDTQATQTMTDEAIIEYAKASAQDNEEEVPAPKPTQKPRISNSRANYRLSEFLSGWLIGGHCCKRPTK